MKHTQAIKKLIVSVVIIGVFAFYSLMRGHSTTTALPLGASANVTSSTHATSTPRARYKDGTYTGAAADAQWGVVQVRAIIQKGKLTNVQFVQFPDKRERSVTVNKHATPLLASEAIQAQSAQVDVVTGATDTSDAFMQSLADALSQAHA